MTKQVSEKAMQYIADRLSASTSAKAGINFDSVNPDTDYEQFEELSEAIVEPGLFANEEASEYYEAFIEEDTDNWVQYITSLLGDGWGKIAKLVAENGY